MRRFWKLLGRTVEASGLLVPAYNAVQGSQQKTRVTLDHGDVILGAGHSWTEDYMRLCSKRWRSAENQNIAIRSSKAVFNLQCEHLEPRHLLSDVTQATDFRPLGQWGGAANDVVVVGQTAYLVEGSALRVVDVSNSADPVVLGNALLPALGTKVVVQDTLAYVLTGYSSGYPGIQIVDVSQPTSPIIISRYVGPGPEPEFSRIIDFAIDGQYAYVIQSLPNSIVLAVVDISNPSNPIQVGSFDQNGSRVEVADDHVYLVHVSTGVHILNVSNPLAPFEEAIYPYAASSDIAIAENRMYLISVLGGFEVADISNPLTPTHLGNIKIQGRGDLISISNNRAYVAGDTGSLDILDVSNPLAVTRLGTDSFDADRVTGIDAHGTLLYMADRDFGMFVIDVSTPASPKGLNKNPERGEDDRVFITGDLAFYWDDFPTGVHVLNLANPRIPSRISVLKPNGAPKEIKSMGQYVYMAYFDVDIYDMSNPVNPPHRIFNIQADGKGTAQDIDIQGSLGYVVTDFGGLHVLNLSNPMNPTTIKYLPIASNVRHVSVSGTRAYVASNGTVYIIDITAPTLPVVVGSIVISNGAFSSTRIEDIQAESNTVYMTTSSDELLVYDTSSPTDPIRIGEYHNTEVGNHAGGLRVKVQDDVVYVADGFEGIRIIDIANPANPRLLQTLQTHNYARDVFVVDNTINAADSGGGFQSYAASDASGNQAASATPIAVPSSVIGAIENPLDEDWYSFTTVAGAEYDLDYSSATLEQATIQLLDTDATGILTSFTSSGSHELRWIAPESATYYIKVSGENNGTGQYVLNLQDNISHSYLIRSEVKGFDIYTKVYVDQSPVPKTTVFRSNGDTLIVRGGNGADLFVMDFVGVSPNPVPNGGLFLDASGSSDDLVEVRVPIYFNPIAVKISDRQIQVDLPPIDMYGVEYVLLKPASAQGFNISSLSVTGSVKVRFSQPASLPLQLPSGLNLGNDSLLDLGSGALVIRGAKAKDPNTLLSIEQWIRAARLPNGSWTGTTGLTSTSARDFPNHLTGLVVTPNIDPQGKKLKGFEAFDTTDLIIMYTWNGDTNLDRRLDIDDYTRIDSEFLAQIPGVPVPYHKGDFNFDKVINIDDYNLIDLAFLGQNKQVLD
jgi:hypothetical protein